MTPNIEQDLEASLADLDTTREQETSKTWMQQAENSLGATISGATGSDKPNGEPGGIAMWIAKLPKNISVGLIDAAVNTADAVKAFAGAAPPVWEPASKITTDAKAKEAKAKTQPESPLDQVYAEYPSLKQYGFQFQDSPKKPGDMRKLEFYPPGESDSTFADKSKPGIDRFDPSMGKADVLGEMLHYLPSVDPAVKQIRTQFQASITPEQADKWLKGDYQNEVKGGVYGAKPPTYEDWLQKQGGDALFRGYLSKQFPEEAYTPEQKTLLDHLGQQLKSPPAALGESGIYDNAKQGVMNFRDYLTQGDGTSDEVTQAISQYAIPFLGYSKLIGGLHSATMLGSMAKAGVAEAATAATVLKPHDPRAADILQLGKHVEGKFGDAMNTIAPDGSLLNHYINYMTDRSNESDAEGRFKNVVDNLALSAAAAGLIKTTAMTLKGGFATAKYALENAGTGPRGLAAQKGVAAFHVTPHDFSQFDMSKIGTGEGNQSFGHGLYFAESTSTAGKYVQNFWDTHGRAHVMKVDIPDAVKAKALDWDAPLSEQPDVLKKLGLDPSAVAPFAHAPYSEVTGQQLYTAMSRGQTQMGTMSKEAASKKLNEFGIPGIRYLDAGSRDAKGGTSNIVLFDSKHAEITHKDGTPVTPATKGKK